LTARVSWLMKAARKGQRRVGTLKIWIKTISCASHKRSSVSRPRDITRAVPALSPTGSSLPNFFAYVCNSGWPVSLDAGDPRRKIYCVSTLLGNSDISKTIRVGVAVTHVVARREGSGYPQRLNVRRGPLRLQPLDVNVPSEKRLRL
jgi:hypothetical protein